jgi:FkbM family methyltransferase
VIDVGANRGQFALFAARRFPDASLICFEPLPDARLRLERALGDRARLRLSEFAVSDTTGPAQFHVAMADDSSSLLPIGSRQRDAFPGTRERCVITVQVRRLDDVLTADELVGPTLMKVDVQGSELSVLEGAEQLLASVDALLVEASFVELYDGQALAGDVVEHLHGRRFTCRGVWSVAYGPRNECLQGDFLFARDGFDPLSL